MRNLNCFVASAFGYSDVDLIYDKTIKVVLKELKIRPLRVDRINHNDKIDKKIIELINQCDFGIVDLTYARPSAYFEAGYLEGLDKGVIYISRKDHFKSDQSDSFGNQKIHFDLITKNIIPWTAPTARLKNLLSARIRLVTRPIISKLNIAADEIDSRKEFESIPLTDRLKLVRQTVLDFLNKKRFREIKNDWSAYDTFKRRDELAKFEIYDTITQDALSYLHLRKSKNLGTPQTFFRIFCSLRSTPKSRIEKALRLYHPIKEKIYRNENTIVIIIDSIDSIFKLRRKLNELSLM